MKGKAELGVQLYTQGSNGILPQLITVYKKSLRKRRLNLKVPLLI